MNKALIVITGASSGIGAAMAKTFSEAGQMLLGQLDIRMATYV